MRAEDVIQKFRESGALLEGHFVLTSGLHSSVYLQCALVLQHPKSAEEFGRAIAENFRDALIQAVAAPAIGGIVIGHEVARALGVRFIWTERVDGKMTLRRGFSVSPGERLLVVEDVVTTGGSTRETIDVLLNIPVNCCAKFFGGHFPLQVHICNLALRVDAGVSPTRSMYYNIVTFDQRKRPGQFALHRAQLALHLPAMEISAVVLNNELEIHS